MARRQPLVDKGWAGRQRQGVLSDIVGRIRQQALAKRIALLFGRARANQHAVAARAVNLFHDHQFKIAQHVAEIFRLTALPGGNIAQDRLLAQIEADHLRYEGVDRFIVGDAGTDGVGQHHAPGAIHRQQPRNA